MPQKNALIVDSDRDVALAVAAAVRSDGVKVGIADLDQDLVERIQSDKPDIICLRAELSGDDSGYTLCAKVKAHKDLSETAVFLYTTDATDEAIETHKNQEICADKYLKISTGEALPEEELREGVRNILFPQGTGAVPPPLPPPRTPTPSPPVRSEEDTNFISELSDSLVEEKEAESSSPPRRFGSMEGFGGRGGAMADAKVEMLRQKLKQRESQLKRASKTLSTMNAELHAFKEKLDEKDIENRFLEERNQELQGALEKTL